MGKRNGPWTGLTYHDGSFYLSEGGQLEGGKILRIEHDGTVNILVENLPSLGDHHTKIPVVKDDYVYFGQGTATNSAVVGKDNTDFGWLLTGKVDWWQEVLTTEFPSISRDNREVLYLSRSFFSFFKFG